MEILLVLALLTSSMFYLGSRAVVTRWLWSRYPPALARFMDCAACSGFWYGLLIGTLAFSSEDSSVWKRSIPLTEWWSPIVIALCSVVWTPIVAGLMQVGFEQLGSAIPEEADGEAD